MTAVEERTTVRQRFRAFVKKNGPSFIWGQLSSPYDGCFYLNVPVLAKGRYAFVCADLKGMKGGGGWFDRAQYVQSLPKGLTAKELAAGCIKFEDLEQVLGGGCFYKDDLEFHPIAELEANTPYQMYRQVLDMCEQLKIDLGDQFKCPCCGTSLRDSEELCYFESEFQGNGGIGIEVGHPVCQECYDQRRCYYCAADGLELWQNHVDEDGEHCIFCAEKIFCRVSGQEVELEWNSTEEEVEAYREGLSVEGKLALDMTEDHVDRATADLFEKKI